MRRTRRTGLWLVAAMAAVVVAIAIAWRATGPARARGGGVASEDDTDLDPRGVARAGGISARQTDSAARGVVATVIADDGEPLEGGHVSLRCLDGDEVTAFATGALVIDESGQFSGPGCRGRVCATLHHPTAIAAEPWVLDPGEPAVLRAVDLPRLFGTVVDGRGRPIAAARVHVRAGIDADPTAVMPTVTSSTTTDADGVFSFALVRRPPCDPCTEIERGCDDPGLALLDSVLLAVHAEGFAPARVEVDVDLDGDDDGVDIRLGRPTDAISGALADADGAAYPRATIVARASDDPTEQHQATLAGTSFVFESLGTGPYDLRAIQDGVELATAARVWPGDDLELVGARVARGPDLELEIVDEGVPVSGVTVDGGPFRGARTDLDGRVRATAAMPGDYTLTLRAPGRDGQRRAIAVRPRGGARDVASADPEAPPDTKPYARPDTAPDMRPDARAPTTAPGTDDLVRVRIDLAVAP